MKYKILSIFPIFLRIYLFQIVIADEYANITSSDEIYDRIVPKSTDNPLDSIAYSLMVEHLKRPIPKEATQEKPHMTGYYVLDTHMPHRDVTAQSSSNSETVLPSHEEVRHLSGESASEYGSLQSNSEKRNNQVEDSQDQSQDSIWSQNQVYREELPEQVGPPSISAVSDYGIPPLSQDDQPPSFSSVSEYDNPSPLSQQISNSDHFPTHQLGSPSIQSQEFQNANNVSENWGTPNLHEHDQPPSHSSISEYANPSVSNQQFSSNLVLPRYQLGSDSIQSHVYHSPNNVSQQEWKTPPITLSKKERPPSILSVSEYGVSSPVFNYQSKYESTTGKKLERPQEINQNFNNFTLQNQDQNQNQNSDYNIQFSNVHHSDPSSEVRNQNVQFGNTQQNISSYNSADGISSSFSPPPTFVDIGILRPQSKVVTALFGDRLPPDFQRSHQVVNNIELKEQNQASSPQPLVFNKAEFQEQENNPVNFHQQQPKVVNNEVLSDHVKINSHRQPQVVNKEEDIREQNPVDSNRPTQVVNNAEFHKKKNPIGSYRQPQVVNNEVVSAVSSDTVEITSPRSPQLVNKPDISVTNNVPQIKSHRQPQAVSNIGVFSSQVAVNSRRRHPQITNVDLTTDHTPPVDASSDRPRIVNNEIIRNNPPRRPVQHPFHRIELNSVNVTQPKNNEPQYGDTSSLDRNPSKSQKLPQPPQDSYPNNKQDYIPLIRPQDLYNNPIPIPAPTKATTPTPYPPGDGEIERAVEILTKFSDDFMAQDYQPPTTQTTFQNIQTTVNSIGNKIEISTKPVPVVPTTHSPASTFNTPLEFDISSPVPHPDHHQSTQHSSYNPTELDKPSPISTNHSPPQQQNSYKEAEFETLKEFPESQVPHQLQPNHYKPATFDTLKAVTIPADHSLPEQNAYRQAEFESLKHFPESQFHYHSQPISYRPTEFESLKLLPESHVHHPSKPISYRPTEFESLKQFHEPQIHNNPLKPNFYKYQDFDTLKRFPTVEDHHFLPQPGDYKKLEYKTIDDDLQPQPQPKIPLKPILFNKRPDFVPIKPKLFKHTNYETFRRFHVPRIYHQLQPNLLQTKPANFDTLNRVKAAEHQTSNPYQAHHNQLKPNSHKLVELDTFKRVHNTQPQVPTNQLKNKPFKSTDLDTSKRVVPEPSSHLPAEKLGNSFKHQDFDPRKNHQVSQPQAHQPFKSEIHQRPQEKPAIRNQMLSLRPLDTYTEPPRTQPNNFPEQRAASNFFQDSEIKQQQQQPQEQWPKGPRPYVHTPRGLIQSDESQSLSTKKEYSRDRDREFSTSSHRIQRSDGSFPHVKAVLKSIVTSDE